MLTPPCAWGGVPAHHSEVGYHQITLQSCQTLQGVHAACRLGHVPLFVSCPLLLWMFCWRVVSNMEWVATQKLGTQREGEVGMLQGRVQAGRGSFSVGRGCGVGARQRRCTICQVVVVRHPATRTQLQVLHGVVDDLKLFAVNANGC
jgi:hypothetical protein